MGDEIQARLNESLPIRRALTGRDESGKSVFVSFDATPRVIAFETRPGLVFWEMYATDGLPTLTGREADPVPGMVNLVPGPQGSRFRLVQIPPRSVAKPDPAAIDRMLEEYRVKVPGIGERIEKQNFGMHTTETVDYVVVIRGEIILELEDGKTIHLRQADCVIQNGTRHAWRNPFSEPCLLAAVMIGAQREKSSGAPPS